MKTKPINPKILFLVWLAGVIVLTLTAGALYWNFSVFGWKLAKIGQFKNIDVTQLYKRLDDLLKFHPELATEDLLMQIAYPVVREAIDHNIQDVPKLLALVEQYAPKDHTRPVVYLAKLYALRYFKNQKEVDYLKALQYYTLTLQLRPNDGIALYDLVCFYRVRQYLHPDEKTPLKAIEDKIAKIWGPVAPNSRCTVGD